MRLAHVIGSVTLAHWHPSITGKRFILAIPASLQSLKEASVSRNEEVVILDDLHVRDGDRIGFSEGAEAASPFLPEKKPIDAYAACLIDEILLSHEIDPLPS